MANTFIFDDDDQPEPASSMMSDQGDDEQAPEEEGEGNNKMFIMILIGIGVFALLAFLCIGGFVLFKPGGPFNANLAATSVVVTAEAIVQQTQAAAVLTSAVTPLSIATEVTPTSTSVLVVFATDTPLPDTPTIDPEMATLQVQQTELANIQAQTTATFVAKATTSPRTTATPRIPKTGFADEVGLPGLVIVTLILLGVILLARRLRANPA